MANEVTVTASISVDESSIVQAISEAGVTFDLANTAVTKYVDGVQDIATTETAIDMGDVASPGWFFAKNLDATNFIELFAATVETAFAKLLPGEFIMGKLSAVAPTAKADTAACALRWFLYEA